MSARPASDWVATDLGPQHEPRLCKPPAGVTDHGSPPSGVCRGTRWSQRQHDFRGRRGRRPGSWKDLLSRCGGLWGPREGRGLRRTCPLLLLPGVSEPVGSTALHACGSTGVTSGHSLTGLPAVLQSWKLQFGAFRWLVRGDRGTSLEKEALSFLLCSGTHFSSHKHGRISTDEPVFLDDGAAGVTGSNVTGPLSWRGSRVLQTQFLQRDAWSLTNSPRSDQAQRSAGVTGMVLGSVSCGKSPVFPARGHPGPLRPPNSRPR